MQPVTKPGHTDWRIRAVIATMGNRTRLGTILISVLRKEIGRRPRFGASAIINREGYVLTDFVDRRGTFHANHAICRVGEFRDNFRRLADALKLDDAERKEMMDAIKQWIARDDRPRAEREKLL